MNCWAHFRGQEAESIVQNFYETKGFEILYRRLKTPFAEVDLVARDQGGSVLVIEVKSLANEEFLEFRIKETQKRRLKRASIYIANSLRCNALLVWAFVKKNQEVIIIEES